MNKLLDKKNIAVMQIAAGAVMISFSPVFVNIANVESCIAGFYRMLFGGLCLTGIIPRQLAVRRFIFITFV